MESSLPSQRKYTERIDIPFPSGTKDRAQRAADKAGSETIASFIRRLVLKALDRSEGRSKGD